MKPKQKVLISGGGGMLAEAVVKQFVKNNLVVVTGRKADGKGMVEMDVGDICRVEKVISESAPDLIIHLAALTDVDYCQGHEDECLRINTQGTENVALMAKKVGATMIYVSTAAVFDGVQESYSEFDCPKPVNTYGRSKYLGEQFVREYLNKYYIFRAGWMIGGGVERDKKFVNKIYQLIKSGKKELMVVADKFGSITYTNDMADSMEKIVNSGYYGLYHQVCTDVCSRYEIAVRLVELLGVEVKVNGVKSSYFEKEYSANRPTFEVLTNTMAKLRGIDYMRSWKECLEEYVKVFRRDLKGV